MEVEHSFGILPYRLIEGQYEFFLIEHHAGHFTFPKGHPEGSETNVETALRELMEEVGITDITVDTEKIFETEYDLTRKNGVIHKFVGYFLGRIENDPPLTLQASEVKNALWLPFESAKTQITFPEDRTVLTDAMAYLEHQSK